MQDTTLYYVYKHTFPNNKVYIGITSQKPERRWGKDGNGYLYLRKKEYPCQPKIYNAIKKYGWENVKHEILAEVNQKEKAISLEILYITQIYHSNDPKFGYNIEKGGKYGGCGFFQGKNRYWWNNGKKNKIASVCPGDGWVRGKYISPKEYLTYKGRNKSIKYPTHAFCKIHFKFKVKRLGIKVYNPNIIPKSSFQKRSESFSGRMWWNNGIIQKFSKECPGKNWIKGRLFTGNEHSHWWNNGKKNAFCKESPGPDWKLGKLLTGKAYKSVHALKALAKRRKGVKRRDWKKII